MMRKRNARCFVSAALLLGGASLVLGTGCLEEGEPVLAPLDTEPPTLVRTTPPGGEAPVRIAPADPLVLIFSEPMDPFSLRAGIEAKRAGTVDLVPLRVAVQPEDPAAPPLAVRGDAEFLVEIRPEAAGGFEPNASYELILTTGLSDTEGNPFATEVVVPFTTGP